MIKTAKIQMAVALFAIIAANTSVAIADTQQCIDYTVAHWGVPKALLLGVHQVEGGKPGTIAWNKNKTFDMGPMQFNSSTVAGLAKYGVTQNQMRNNECASFYVAGWTLSNSARRFHDWRLAIAAYNCGDGCVAKALKKLNTPFHDVTTLDIPPKTKNEYVPMVIAAWNKHSKR